MIQLGMRLERRCLVRRRSSHHCQESIILGNKQMDHHEGVRGILKIRFASLRSSHNYKRFAFLETRKQNRLFDVLLTCITASILRRQKRPVFLYLLMGTRGSIIGIRTIVCHREKVAFFRIVKRACLRRSLLFCCDLFLFHSAYNPGFCAPLATAMMEAQIF